MVIKAVIRESDIRQDGKCNIKLRITHHRKALYLSTTYYIEPKYFDNTQGIVKDAYPNAKYLNIGLKLLVLKAEQKLLELGDKVETLNIGSIARMIKDMDKKTDVFSLFTKVISDKQRSGSIKNAVNYRITLDKLKAFHPYKELSFQSIDYRFLDEFQTWMKEKKLKVNTISINMRNLRSVFNKAINAGVIGYDVYPFRRFKIKSEQTPKRNLPVHIIGKIAKVKLTGKTEMARDMFMLSFYLIAMNIPDIYNLKKTDLLEDRIKYRRQKTRKIISVKVYPEAQEIINKYKAPYKSKHLLNISEQYAEYNNMTKRVNVELKKVAQKIGLIEPVSFYYVRHSWSTIAVTLGISRDVVGMALSHSSDTVTDVYIAYDPAIIDQANRKVIDAVLNAQNTP